MSKSTSTAATIGMHMATAPLVGYGMGWYLDNKLLPTWFGWETDPFVTIFMLIMGIISGYKMVFEDLKRLEREEKMRQERESGGNGEGTGE